MAKKFTIGKHLAQRTSSTSAHMKRPLLGKVIRKGISKPFYSSMKLHGSLDSKEDMSMTCLMGKKKSVYEPKWPIRPELIPVSVALSD